MSDEYNHIPDIINKAEKMNNQGTQQVAFEDYFSKSFMEDHTNYQNIYDFLNAGNFGVDSIDDIDEKQLDNFINKNSDLTNWHDFRDLAGQEYIANRLGFSD